MPVKPIDAREWLEARRLEDTTCDFPAELLEILDEHEGEPPADLDDRLEEAFDSERWQEYDL